MESPKPPAQVLCPAMPAKPTSALKHGLEEIDEPSSVDSSNHQALSQFDDGGEKQEHAPNPAKKMRMLVVSVHSSVPDNHVTDTGVQQNFDTNTITSLDSGDLGKLGKLEESEGSEGYEDVSCELEESEGSEGHEDMESELEESECTEGHDAVFGERYACKWGKCNRGFDSGHLLAVSQPLPSLCFPPLTEASQTHLEEYHVRKGPYLKEKPAGVEKMQGDCWVKPQKCGWKDCEVKIKKRRYHLCSHVRMHVDNYRPPDDKGKCPYCELSFPMSQTMRKHVKAKHPGGIAEMKAVKEEKFAAEKEKKAAAKEEDALKNEEGVAKKMRAVRKLRDEAKKRREESLRTTFEEWRRRRAEAFQWRGRLLDVLRPHPRLLDPSTSPQVSSLLRRAALTSLFAISTRSHSTRTSLEPRSLPSPECWASTKIRLPLQSAREAMHWQRPLKKGHLHHLRVPTNPMLPLLQRPRLPSLLSRPATLFRLACAAPTVSHPMLQSPSIQLPCSPPARLSTISSALNSRKRLSWTPQPTPPNCVLPIQTTSTVQTSPTPSRLPPNCSSSSPPSIPVASTLLPSCRME